MEYKYAIQEERFEYKGFPCVVLMQAIGFRTGYVGIPKGHELYGVDYEKIDVDCHGGLTFANDKLTDQEDKDIWWIGYDCAHYNDGHDMDRCKELFKDYPDVVRQIELTLSVDKFEIYSNKNGKTLDFCKDQCKHIVDQIVEKGYSIEMKV